MLISIILSYIIVISLIGWFIVQFIQLFHRCYVHPMITDLYNPIIPINTNLHLFNDALRLEEIETKTCSICLDDLDLGVKLKCGHIYHQECINKWITTEFSMDKKCPLCNCHILQIV